MHNFKCSFVEGCLFCGFASTLGPHVTLWSQVDSECFCWQGPMLSPLGGSIPLLLLQLVFTSCTWNQLASQGSWRSPKQWRKKPAYLCSHGYSGQSGLRTCQRPPASTCNHAAEDSQSQLQLLGHAFCVGHMGLYFQAVLMQSKLPPDLTVQPHTQHFSYTFCRPGIWTIFLGGLTRT
jgi:hypothetical protein